MQVVAGDTVPAWMRCAALLLPASPARNEPLQPDEKALEDTAFSHFLARQESPQFAAVRGLMQQATTLGAFRRLAADPEAMRAPAALLALPFAGFLPPPTRFRFAASFLDFTVLKIGRRLGNASKC